MDLKSLAVGLVCGVVIGAVAVSLLAGSNYDEVLPSAERRVDEPDIPGIVSVAAPAKREPEEAPIESNSEDKNRQPEIEAPVVPVAPWPENLWAELNLESRDGSWAYYMEQTLLQFLSSHPSIDQFDISRIECRMTKCQIEVFGFDESTVPVWHQVMYDIRQQSWNEFSEYGSSTGTVDGRITIVGTFLRMPET